MKDQNKNEIIHSIANALVAAIPIIGGSVNSLIGDYQVGRKLSRLQSFYDSMKTDFVELKSKVNQEYISNDDFLDVFEETAKRIVNERTEQKRIAFKNILLNSILGNEVDYDYTEENLRLLEKIRKEHLFFLKFFDDPRKINNERNQPLNERGGFSTSLNQLISKLLPEWEEEKILDICTDLENERLLNNFVGSYKTMITDQGIIHLENKLTLKGKRFFKFVTRPNE